MGQHPVTTPRLAFGPEAEGGGTPYERYARLDVLHTLQQPRSKVDAELSFIITTQVMELLFDLLRHGGRSPSGRCARTTCPGRWRRCGAGRMCSPYW